MQSYIQDDAEAAMKFEEEDFWTYTPNQPIPYYNEKLFDIVGNIFNVKPSELIIKIPEKLIDAILMDKSSDRRYNISATNSGAHYFMGYPNGNLLKQLWAILTLWNERAIFPVTFLAMSEMEDNTGWEIERLNTLTDDVRDIFKMLSSGWIVDIYK